MNSTNLFSKGARLVWRHQRIAWWIFAVNLVLGWFATGPVRNAISGTLDHSLASEQLVQHFNLSAMIELFSNPNFPLHSLMAASMHLAVIFLLYMIFIDGGVLTVFREDRKITTAEFFEMSGAYFWRMVRLVLISLIPFAILAGIAGAVSGMSDKLSNNAASDKTGFWVLVVGNFILWLAFLTVRAWFDLAQSMTVAQNDRGMWRNSWRGLVLTLRNIGSLLGAYVSIHIVGIVSMCLVFLMWLHIPHTAARLSFLLLEFLLLIEIFVRLWQKAACMTWLENRTVVVATPAYELAPNAEVSGALPPDAFPDPGESGGTV